MLRHNKLAASLIARETDLSPSPEFYQERLTGIVIRGFFGFIYLSDQ